MASPRFSLAAATTAEDTRPQLFVLYSPPKWGKTTLICDIPRLFILVPEEGLAGIAKPAPHYPREPRTLAELHEALEAFAEENRGAGRAYDHLAIDSLSWVQDMIHVAARAGQRTDNLDGDFRSAWGAVETLWIAFFAKLAGVQRRCGVHIWLIAHAEQRDDVALDGSTFKKWDLELHKKAAPFVRRTVGHVLFCNFYTQVTKGGKGKRSIGKHTARLVYFRDSPDHFAGSRSTAPDQCPATARHLLAALASKAPADEATLRAQLEKLVPRLPADERAPLEEEIKAARGPRDLARSLAQAQSILANLGEEEPEEPEPAAVPAVTPPPAPIPATAPRTAPPVQRAAPVTPARPAPVIAADDEEYTGPAAPLAAPVVAAPALPAPASAPSAAYDFGSTTGSVAPVEPARPAAVASAPAQAQRPAAPLPVASDLTPEQQARAAVDACKDGPSIRNCFGLLSKLALSPEERSGFANELRQLKARLGIGV